jgi:hypothetical protein
LASIDEKQMRPEASPRQHVISIQFSAKEFGPGFPHLRPQIFE